MKPLTPKRIAGAVKSRAKGLVRRAAALAGIEVHREGESRAYWEDRGSRYSKEVSAILDPSDPFFHAQTRFLDELAALEWSSIVEVGCGFGWHLKAVADRFPGRRVAGFDFSLSQLVEGKSYLAGSSARLFQGSAYQIPVPDETFDVVYTSGLLVCVHPAQLALAFGELRRVARRSVIALEYAREHMETPEQASIMRAASWYGHRYGDEFTRANLEMVASFRFPSFEGHPQRIPLSFFHGVKR